MSKLDSEFKNEVNTSFKEFDYVSRKGAVRIGLWILIICLLSASGGVAYKKWKVNKDREIFKQSATYNESVASFLADSYRQFNDTTDKTEQNTIMQYVVMRYPNLDSSKIENVTLRQFYNKCLGGK